MDFWGWVVGSITLGVLQIVTLRLATQQQQELNRINIALGLGQGLLSVERAKTERLQRELWQYQHREVDDVYQDEVNRPAGREDQDARADDARARWKQMVDDLPF